MSKGSLECKRVDPKLSKKQHYEWNVTWRTTNLYKLCVGRIGQSIVSPVFKLKQNDALIYIFPQSLKANCNSNKRRISFSIYLHIVKRIVYPLQGSVSFHIIKPALPLGEVQILDESRVPNYGWGFHKSLYRKWFTDKICWSGTTISCKITLARQSFFKETCWYVDTPTSPKLANDLRSLLENGNFYDVTIKVGDQELKAHKSILSARSPVFAAMFNTGMMESTSNEINISNVQFKVVQLLLEFIYTGKLDNTGHSMEIIDELLITADMYEVVNLKMRCGEMLADNVDHVNVIKYLYLAHKFSMSDLFRSALHTVKFNWEEISNSEEWKELKKSDNDLVFFVNATLDDDQYKSILQ